MKITLAQLKLLKRIDKAVIHSLDMCLYRASVVIDGQEYQLTDNRGQFLRSHNKLDLQSQLQNYPVQQVVLRHQSAYDEMVGQPLRQGSNALEVPLGGSALGPDQHPPEELH